MKDLIAKITSGKELEAAYSYAIHKIYTEGPTSITALEILAYLKKYQASFFSLKEDEVINLMGLYYKESKVSSLREVVFKHFGEAIQEEYEHSYTPVQSSIVDNISKFQNFSFSAPTSTGKSFIFNNLIKFSNKDIVIIVPSRALINEYFTKLYREIPDKSVNILTSVCVINTKHAKRNIFVLTPERTKELFQYKDIFDIEFFLFDEAQLSDDDSFRGLFFDSIVRRVQLHFPTSKCIFAHPFVENPDAQLIKNNFPNAVSGSIFYKEKNIGQIFYTHENNKFHHFGISKDVMGNTRQIVSHDPIYDCITQDRSILIYTSKSSIYNREVFKVFKTYIDLCHDLTNDSALSIINELQELIGASTSSSEFYFSKMIEMLKKGIVIHHGSLPLKARLLLEEFTQKGFCSICFATSTLEQGINMPFDIVYINRFEKSKPLSVKNLIGRAGRSTLKSVYDYGIVIIKGSGMSGFRNVMKNNEKLKVVSQLDETSTDDENREFKEAIKNNEFSDEYNLPTSEVIRLSQASLDDLLKEILKTLFLKPPKDIWELTKNLIELYSYYLKRELSIGEESILHEAISLFLYSLHGRKFHEICKMRYNKTVQADYQKQLRQSNNSTLVSNLSARFIQGYADVPNKSHPRYSLFNKNIKVYDVDYDRIVCDTYDYFDKLINFRLSDIYYTIFYKYYERSADANAKKLALIFRYGTDDERNILLIKYGLSKDEIDEFSDYVESVTEKELVVKPEIVTAISPSKLTYIKRFIHNIE